MTNTVEDLERYRGVTAAALLTLLIIAVTVCSVLTLAQ